MRSIFVNSFQQQVITRYYFDTTLKYFKVVSSNGKYIFMNSKTLLINLQRLENTLTKLLLQIYIQYHILIFINRYTAYYSLSHYIMTNNKMLKIPYPFFRSLCKPTQNIRYPILLT